MLQAVIVGLVLGSIYALAASGLVITYVSTGVGWQTTQCGSAGAKPDYLFCGLADTTTKVIEAIVLRV